MAEHNTNNESEALLREKVAKQEYLINHVMESQSADQVKRLVVLENEGQARKVTIDNVVAFCLVDTTSGVVSYYTKK